MSKLYFRYGAMNCGKSSALMQVAYNYEQNNKKVIVIKSEIDTKGNNYLESRIGLKRKVDILLKENESIEKYYDKKLPENLACIMIDLANLPEVNSLYDHATGNILLKDFSTILSSASLSLCFVGRNGGNKFLAIFENGEQEKLDTFLARVADRVKQHNLSSDAIAIEYHTGVAMNSKEHMDQITNLIALANKRIYENS